MNTSVCPLCFTPSKQRIYSNVVQKEYTLCSHCFLIWISPDLYLDPKDEKARYALHNNTIEAKGYVDFLEKAILPTLPFINSHDIGLDFGCGPDSVLAKLLHRRNIKCHYYDPYFFPELPNIATYDFMFATECFEHFYYPKTTIDKIFSLLHPQSIFTVMTELWQDENHFSNWYYTKDPTHVCFYHAKTFDYIAQTYHLQYLYNNHKRVIVFKKIK